MIAVLHITVLLCSAYPWFQVKHQNLFLEDISELKNKLEKKLEEAAKDDEDNYLGRGKRPKRRWAAPSEDVENISIKLNNSKTKCKSVSQVQ